MLKENNFDALRESMATKSDSELNDYLKKKEECSADELTAVIVELKKRGKVFDEPEWEFLLSVIRAKLWGADAELKSYYSPLAIFCLSFFFSVLFGAAVFSTNLKTRYERYVVIGFGFIYFLSQLTLAKVHPTDVWIHLGFHVIGCALSSLLYWRTYIRTTRYYWKEYVGIPIFVGVLFIMVFIPAISSFLGYQDNPFYRLGWNMGKFVAQQIN